MKFIKQWFFFIPSVSKWLTDCKHKNREEQRIVNKRILNILLSIGSSIYTDVASRYCKYQYDIKFFTLLNTIFNLSDEVTQSITMGDPFSTEYQDTGSNSRESKRKTNLDLDSGLNFAQTPISSGTSMYIYYVHVYKLPFYIFDILTLLLFFCSVICLYVRWTASKPSSRMINIFKQCCLQLKFCTSYAFGPNKPKIVFRR